MCKLPLSSTTSNLTQTATANDNDSENTPNSTTVVNDRKRVVTARELFNHGTPSSAWTAVHGRVLDITQFAKRHPGGDLIFLSAGRDGTALFETYHPRNVPNSLLDKLQVGVMAAKNSGSVDIADNTTPDSATNANHEEVLSESFYSWSSEFYPTLKKRVVERLESRGLSRRGSNEIWIKALLILVSFWASLVKMYTADTFGMACVYSMLMGIAAHFVGTCIQHDGNHGAFAKTRFMNKLAGWTLDMIGASAFTWEIQHMLGHHPYTNLLDTDEDERKESTNESSNCIPDQESDPDVFSSFPLMRMHPHHQPKWYHAYQHIYAPLLFAGMTLAKVMQQDIEVATNKKLYHIDARCRYASILNVLRFWSMKLISSIYMVALPCYFHGLSRGIFLFFLGHMTCGEVLATMFIVNHVIDGVAFAKKGAHVDGNVKDRPTTSDGITPMESTQQHVIKQQKQGPNKKSVPYNDWAAVQCQTSVNWSCGSWFWNHFSGGLSHQIEHHLFPSICHTNYVYIHDVVRQTCEEFGVPYQSEHNLFVAYKHMLKHLKNMGTAKSISSADKKNL
mmetsp:Transcript_6092/g.8865  ORF Transcript_6092/g.8865 Transcript_6092/m.8865 type:complete len:563 (+) Transcript_6092:127-1815(+)